MIQASYISKKALDERMKDTTIMISTKKYKTELISYFFINDKDKIYVSIADIERVYHIRIKEDHLPLKSYIMYLTINSAFTENKTKTFKVIEKDILIEIIKTINDKDYDIAFDDSIIEFLESMRFEIKDCVNDTISDINSHEEYKEKESRSICDTGCILFDINKNW